MPEWLVQIAGYLFVGGMAWGAIRADLRGLHDGLSEVKKSAARAHARIDGHVERHHVRVRAGQ